MLHWIYYMNERKFSVMELFAGAGGMALGLEKSGLTSIMLNDVDKDSCNTLRKNRPQWNVVPDDIGKRIKDTLENYFMNLIDSASRVCHV